MQLPSCNHSKSCDLSGRKNRGNDRVCQGSLGFGPLSGKGLSWAVDGPDFFDDAATTKVIPRISSWDSKDFTQVVFPVLDGLGIEISGDAPAGIEMRDHEPVHLFRDGFKALLDILIEPDGLSKKVHLAHIIAYLSLFVLMIEEEEFLQVTAVSHLSDQIRCVENSAKDLHDWGRES